MENQNQLKFFIVDDDVFCGNLYEQYLINLKYNDITFYSNGPECLNNLHLRPDIIFLDYNMERMNGFEVLKKIKATNPNIYVVMISSQDNIKTAVEAINNGAFDYITKDNDVFEKMSKIISNIILIKEQLKKSKPKFFEKYFSIQSLGL